MVVLVVLTQRVVKEFRVIVSGGCELFFAERVYITKFIYFGIYNIKNLKYVDRWSVMLLNK